MNQAETKRKQAEAIGWMLSGFVLLVAMHIIGENGIAYLGIALMCYFILWILFVYGISDVLGRLLRSRKTKGQFKNAEKMKKSVLGLQLILGMVGALLLVAMSFFSVNVFRMRYISLLLLILAPGFFFLSISTSLRAVFQGNGTELPSAVISILRPIFTLGFGMLFGKMLFAYGEKVSAILLEENFIAMYGAAGFAIGISLSELFLLLFEILLGRTAKQERDAAKEDGMRFVDSSFDCIRKFLVLRSPYLFLGILSALPIPLVFFFWLKKTENAEESAAQLGTYFGGYLSLVFILISLISFFCIPVVSQLLSYLRKEETRSFRNTFLSGMHLCLAHGMISGVFLLTLSEGLGLLLCKNESILAAKLISAGSFTVLFLSLSFYFGRILFLTGRRMLLAAAIAMADVIFAILSGIFLQSGGMGVLSFAFGGLISSGILCVMLGAFGVRQFRCRMDYLGILLIPVGSAVVTGLLMLGISKALLPHLGSLMTLLVCFVLGELLYWSILLILRNFTENELEVLPGGGILLWLGRAFRVF